MHADPPDEGARVVAVDEQQLERVQEHQHELNLQAKKKLSLRLTFILN